MRFLREGSIRHESSGRKRMGKRRRRGRERERDGSRVQKGPTVFNIFTKMTRLRYSTYVLFLRFPFKILPCGFFLMEWKFIF